MSFSIHLLVEVLKNSWNQIEEDISLLEEVAVLIEFESNRPQKEYLINHRFSTTNQLAVGNRNKKKRLLKN